MAVNVKDRIGVMEEAARSVRLGISGKMSLGAVCKALEGLRPEELSIVAGLTRQPVERLRLYQAQAPLVT